MMGLGKESEREKELSGEKVINESRKCFAFAINKWGGKFGVMEVLGIGHMLLIVEVG